MKYTKYTTLYPPRPEAAIPPQMLNFYEKKGWWAQYKKNGTNTVIWIPPNKKIIYKNRHGEAHRAWSMPDFIREQLALLFPEKKWFVLCAELMHSKTKQFKDILYLHDMLVWKGEFLLGSTFRERQEIMDERLITNVETHSHYVCDDLGKIWYAKRFEENFQGIWRSIKDPKVDEGLVLKDPEGKLRACLTEKENSSWLAKCRHGHKNYNF